MNTFSPGNDLSRRFNESSFANKVNLDQTAPQELSDQGILYLSIMAIFGPRGIIFICPSTKNVQFE